MRLTVYRASVALRVVPIPNSLPWQEIPNVRIFWIRRIPYDETTDTRETHSLIRVPVSGMQSRKRNRLRLRDCAAITCIAIMSSGCFSAKRLKGWQPVVEPRHASIAPILNHARYSGVADVDFAVEPAKINDVSRADKWPMSLGEVIALALQNDSVLRSLGGQIVSQPDAARSAIDPALIQTNAFNGEQAALAEFDQQFRSSLLWTRADRGVKRQILLSNATSVDSLLAQWDTVLEKRTRSGTTIGIRKTLDYDRDNLGVPPNRFNSSYDNSIGLEIRHPLARGGGKDYLAIAGPNAVAGQYRGVVIARANTNIAVQDFQIALRDYLHDVVRTYWGLHLSYADLKAKEQSLKAAEQTLQAAKEKLDEGLFDADQVFQAQERFHAARAEYLNALSGEPSRSILGILGVSGTPLAGVDIGVLALERRLRYQLGLSASDGRLIYPSDSPLAAPVYFDWNEATARAIAMRPELMRQSTVVHKRRLELKAARNFLLPTVDAIYQYRFRGFGDELFDQGAEDSGALPELFNGDLQEWAAGIEVEWPAGLRLGHEAVRNARLTLAREIALLEQQQHQVGHELAGVFSELERAYVVRASARARYDAAIKHREASKQRFLEGLPIDIETVLDAQRIAAQAASALHVARVDCEIALLKVNVAKATFLSELQIAIQSDEPQPSFATRSQSRTRNVTQATTVPDHAITSSEQTRPSPQKAISQLASTPIERATTPRKPIERVPASKESRGTSEAAKGKSAVIYQPTPVPSTSQSAPVESASPLPMTPTLIDWTLPTSVAHQGNRTARLPSSNRVSPSDSSYLGFSQWQPKKKAGELPANLPSLDSPSFKLPVNATPVSSLPPTGEPATWTGQSKPTLPNSKYVEPSSW